MASMSIHQDSTADSVTVDGQWHTHRPERCYVTLIVGPDCVSVHFADLASVDKLYLQLGNVVAQLHDEQRQGDEIVDLASDPQPTGGTVGVQAGNPTMDAHGPDPSVSYHSQAMDAARASIAHGPQTEAPSAYVAEVQRAAAAADARRRRGDR